MSSVPEHLEHYLGRITRGWKHDPDGRPLPFAVAECVGGVLPGLVSYCTLGLSNTRLISMSTGRSIRQELLVLQRESGAFEGMVGVLQQFASQALETGMAHLAGEVIGPSNLLFGAGELSALYVAAPVYLPSEFSVCPGPDGDDTFFLWLLPITAREARYVKQFGWESFETLLEAASPDLLDIARSSIVR